MGQELFAPPNVKGWPGGKAWLNSATMLARHNFAQNVAAGHVEAAREPDRFNRFVFETADAPNKPPKEAEKPEPARERDCFKIIEKEKISEPRGVVDLLADVLLQDRVAKAPHDKLSAFLAEGKPADTAQRRRVRETAHAIMTMPEYQLA
jgi:hypothetical protein